MAIASHAFAFYYLLQCLVALTATKSVRKRVGTIVVAAALVFITVFVVPAG